MTLPIYEQETNELTHQAAKQLMTKPIKQLSI